MPPGPPEGGERRVQRVIAPPPPHWVGDGFPARTLFAYDTEPEAWSPFLLLDCLGPREFVPTSRRLGVGPHPHRGFETVTLLWAGEVEHRDSAGHGGTIGPGDVQWMTAGDGVLHEELQSAAFGRRGGTLEGVQLWVNLPARDKRTPPRYQDLTAPRIPVVELPGGRVRVVAGRLQDHEGPARTFSPVTLWDVALAGPTPLRLPLPEGHTALLFVRHGPVRVAGQEVTAGRLVELSRSGASVSLASEGGGHVLLMAGEPIREPVAGHGPFVMNTWSEIAEAIDDFSQGRMGRLEPHSASHGTEPDRG